MSTEETEDRKRGWQGRAVAARKAAAARAEYLEKRGWATYPPEMAEWVKALVEKAMA